MKVDEVRSAIDAIDDELLTLLERRARLARQAGHAKQQAGRELHDPEREERVFQRLEEQLPQDAIFPRRSVRPVFREVISACLSVEEQVSVAYFGPPGTFTHMAARRAFGLAARYVECSTIAGVFDAVARGLAGYGVAPIENSTEGGVTFTMDCLVQSDLKIRRELILDVDQCLVGQSSDLGGIQRVYSHPQALAQCKAWLGTNLPSAQLVVAPSTSAAARQASEDASSAAIASKLAAELHGLVVVRERIQDRPENATRFLVLSSQDAPPTGKDRTTVVFSAPHERGALKRVLEIFDGADINLSRIESRPSHSKLWEYVFVTDLEGHHADPQVARALEQLKDCCGYLKVCGSYPRDV